MKPMIKHDQRPSLVSFIVVCVTVTILMGCGPMADDGLDDQSRIPADLTTSQTMAATVHAVIDNPTAFTTTSIGVPAYVKQVINAQLLVIQDDPDLDSASELLVVNSLRDQDSFESIAVGDRVYIEGNLRSLATIPAIQATFSEGQKGRFKKQPVMFATSLVNYDQADREPSAITHPQRP